MKIKPTGHFNTNRDKKAKIFGVINRISSWPGIGYEYSRSMNRVDKKVSKLSGVSIGEVEINKNCNLNCVMCRSWDSKRKNIYMDLEIFRRACVEAKRLGNKKINIYTIGEPLLNPYLEHYFEILHEFNLKAFVSTNGLLLHKNNNIDLLCRNAKVIQAIRFSVDGVTKETYEKIRTPGNFNRLLENLELFKDANQDNKLKVYFNSVLSKDNKDEIARYYSFYSRYTDMLNIDVGLMNGLCPDNSYFFKASILPYHIKRNIPCDTWLFNKKLHVLCNGDVTACCRDYHGDLIYGNIMDNTAEKLINSRKVVALRNEHLNKLVSEDKLCANCYIVDRRVTNLFNLFVKQMVIKYRMNWDEERMQGRFNRFFDLFQDRIPSIQEFTWLCR